MLRLAPPDFDRFLQRPEFNATWGGGEANVAVALGNLGMPVRYVTVLPPGNQPPPANPTARAAPESPKGSGWLPKNSPVCPANRACRTRVHFAPQSRAPGDPPTPSAA